MYLYTDTQEYYSAIKKNEILPSATTCVDLEGIMVSKISQIEKDKYHIISLNVETKKQNQTNPETYLQILRIIKWFPEGQSRWEGGVKEIGKYNFSLME